MKLITPLILLLLLNACGSGSSSKASSPAPVADEQAKVLNEHAYLEGSCLAVSRNIKINGVDYPVATQRIFMVVSGQQNISTESDLNDLKTRYSGTGLRTWRSEAGITEDIYANTWSTSFTFDNSTDLSTGMLSP